MDCDITDHSQMVSCSWELLGKIHQVCLSGTQKYQVLGEDESQAWVIILSGRSQNQETVW